MLENEKQLKGKTDSAQRLSESEQSPQLVVVKAGELIAEKYRVINFIGRGAAGLVYKVEQIFLRKTFALKVFSANEASAKAIVRFQQEAQMGSRLDHPNLVRTVDFGLIGDNQPFLVMDLVEGPTLDTYLRHNGALSIAQATQIFVPICSALAYAHNAGLVHRDIKPGNIMLESAASDFIGRPKLVDFGIARAIEDTGLKLTKTGEIFGTPLYMSPEQCEGRPVDSRGDIYSLGCVLFEALTGLPPFSGATVFETIALHMNSAPTTLKEATMGQDFPPAYQIILNKMMSKNPDDRYPDCNAVKRDLEAAVDNTFTAPVERISSKPKKTPLTFIIAGLAIVILAAFVFWALRAHVASPAVSNKSAGAHPASSGAIDAPVKITKVDLHIPKSYLNSQSKSEYRIFHFPTTAIGNVEIVDTEGKDLSAFWQAANNVTVKKPDQVVFIGTDSLIMDHPEILDAFGPEDLYGLVIQSRPEQYFFSKDNQTIDATLAHAVHLKSLHYLNLNTEMITIDSLKALHIDNLPLRKLALEDTAVDMRELAKLKTMHNLQELVLHRYKSITPLLEGIKGCPTYRKLELKHCNLTDDDMKLIATLPNLAYLDIFGNPEVTAKGLETLTNLKRLDQLTLRDCKIKPADAGVFKKLHLTQLYLPSEYWTKQDLIKLRTALHPHCTLLLDSLVDGKPFTVN